MKEPTITITDAAVNEFKKKLQERKTPDACIRIGVSGKGCHGYTHVIQFEDNPPSNHDTQIFIGELKILIDGRSKKILKGSTIDWKENTFAKGFKISNSNIEGYCGCNASFSLKK